MGELVSEPVSELLLLLFLMKPSELLRWCAGPRTDESERPDTDPEPLGFSTLRF